MILQSGCLDLSLGICKVVVWTRVWTSTKWLFGRDLDNHLLYYFSEYIYAYLLSSSRDTW